MPKLKRSIVGIGSMCLTVVSLLAVYTLLGNATPNPPRQPLNPLPAPTCSFSDKSFCTTEASVKQYIAANDFSDILEDQVPVSVICNGASPLHQYCTGDNGLTLQLFEVRQQAMGIMTRNQYITFFMHYVEQHGPFSFVSTTMDGSNVLMSFKDQATSYTLLFAKQGSTWKISYPTMTVVQ